MFGVLGVSKFSRPWQVKVIQTRDPEAKRTGAQHNRPGLALGRCERPLDRPAEMHALAPLTLEPAPFQIGRASCRERVFRTV